MHREYLPVHEYMIHRSRITDMLEEGVEYGVVNIMAPPGYGKTLALAYFCHHTVYPVFWMHCVKLDQSPERFWQSFISALCHEFPQCANKLEKTSLPSTAEAFDEFMHLFLEEYTDEKIVMIFDNIENLGNSPALHFINTMVEAEIPRLCIMLSSQHVSALMVTESSKRYQISGSDLGFTEEEVVQLSEQYNITLKHSEVQKMQEDMAGWPLAFHLLFVELQHQKIGAFGEALCYQSIFQLFEQKYYKKYSEDIKALLISGALVPYAPLNLIIHSVIDITEQMQQILAENAFINYDVLNQRYIIHPMYRRFLLSKQVLLSQEKIHSVMDKAGQWYLENGRVVDALTCYWNNRDYNNYIKAVTQLPKKWQKSETAQLILQQLDEFPNEYREKDPIVDYSRAFMYLNNHQVKKARYIFEQLLSQLERVEGNQQLLGDIYIALADISNLTGTTMGLTYIKKAAELLINGGRLHSRELLIQENNSVFFLPDDQSESLEKMIAYYFEFTRYSDKLYNGCAAGIEFQFAAEACFFSGQIDQANEYAQRAIYKAKAEKQHDIVVNALFYKMRISIFTGDFKTAVEYLDEITSYVQDMGNPILEDIRDCAICWMYISIGYPEKVQERMQTLVRRSKARLTNPGRTNLYIICYHMIQRNFDEALSLTIELDEILEEKSLWEISIYRHLCKSVCYLMTEREELAMDELWSAYDKTYSDNLWVIFVGLGKDMILLMQAAKKQNRYKFDVQWIEKIYKEAIARAQMKGAILKSIKDERVSKHLRKSVLTEREKEVLHYLGASLTQKEIAAVMGITINGIKKHVTNIYTKLGAVNRTDAINIAIVNGLLAEPDDAIFDIKEGNKRR